jgi:hypothetical protein
MNLQVAERRKAPIWWQVNPIIETISGFEGALLFAGSSLSYSGIAIGAFCSNARSPLSFGCTVTSDSGYDADFVADILKADAAEPEASFDNVVDMLDWLNRE